MGAIIHRSWLATDVERVVSKAGGKEYWKCRQLGKSKVIVGLGGETRIYALLSDWTVSLSV